MWWCGWKEWKVLKVSPSLIRELEWTQTQTQIPTQIPTPTPTPTQSFSPDTHCYTAASLLSTHSRSLPSSSHSCSSWDTLGPAWWSCPARSCSRGCSTWRCWWRRGWSPPCWSILRAGWWCPWCPLPPWNGSGCRWCRGASLQPAAGCSGLGWACRKSWAQSTGTRGSSGPRGTGSGCCWTGKTPGCWDPWEVCRSQ